MHALLHHNSNKSTIPCQAISHFSFNHLPFYQYATELDLFPFRNLYFASSKPPLYNLLPKSCVRLRLCWISKLIKFMCATNEKVDAQMSHCTRESACYEEKNKLVIVVLWCIHLPSLSQPHCSMRLGDGHNSIVVCCTLLALYILHAIAQLWHCFMNPSATPMNWPAPECKILMIIQYCIDMRVRRPMGFHTTYMLDVRRTQIKKQSFEWWW